MAERSKALVSGTSLFGGVGSNPTSVTTFLFFKKRTSITGWRIFCFHEVVSRLAQLVERKTLNLVVVGSSPTVGKLLWRSWQRVGLIILRSRVRSSPGAVIFFPFSNTDLQLRSCFFVLATDFGWMAERSKALV